MFFGRRARVHAFALAVLAFDAFYQAVLEMDHRPGEGGHVGFVRDHQDRDVLLRIQPRQELHDLHRAFAVEIAGRFVGEQHVGTRDQRAGDRDALLLATGEFGRGVVPPVREADGVEARHRRIPTRALFVAAVEQRQFDILQRGRAREQVEPLEHEAEIFPPEQRALVAVERLDVVAAEQEGAVARHVEAA